MVELCFFSFLLLRPPRTSEALKKGSNFGFLTLKYAKKIYALGQAGMEKVSCIYGRGRRRRPSFALLTSFSHISVRIFLLFTFLLWHSLSSTYFCFTQLSFSQFSPGITQPQLSLTLHNFATHTSALAYFCLSSVFYLNL